MPSPPTASSGGDAKKDGSSTSTSASSVVTRNAARKAKIQTRAMATGAKPSASLLAAKKKAQQRKKQPGDKDTVLKDHYQAAVESKGRVRGATGLVTDPLMLEHRCLWDPAYPECPERLATVLDRCRELGLVGRCEAVEARRATRDELGVLHAPHAYELLADARHLPPARLEQLSARYDAIYIHPGTHEAALLAAGGTIELVERVVRGRLQNGAALVRPPGHHAMRAEPCGYCFYNNVALAAHHAVARLGLQRVLVVDWDVHHGQATQQMFYRDPRVLYFSIHRYEHGAFWPGLRQASFEYVGAGEGRGYNVNVPLNRTGMRDDDYLAVFHQLLLPIAHEHRPQLVLCSAGYDSALGDEKGEMELSPACYATLTHLLGGVCPALAVVLEGGYCLESLAEGAALTLRTLLGHAPPALPAPTPPSPSIQDSILNCIYALRPFWRCFDHQPSYGLRKDGDGADADALPAHRVSAPWHGDETRPDTFLTRACYPVQEPAHRQRLLDRLRQLRLDTDLALARHAVGYVYDDAMLKHRNICEPGHVECPERIMRIHERHRDFGLLERVQRVAARRASDAHILAVHSQEHLARLQRLAKAKPRDLHHGERFDSVYFHPDSLESAAVALGCVVQMVEAVVGGEVGCGTCVVRPPGHHAEAGAPSGFCLLNNAAAAARHAVDRLGVRRVLLLDWDVHHGNGTQHLFYDQPEVLYVSLHRYDHGAFFPQSRDADHACAGEGRGLGFNVNIPWNKRGMGDAEYLAAFARVVLPVASEYRPELVIVSAGFDACVGDPLGGCRVSPECFGRLTHYVRGLAGGRVVLCLEGGYNVTAVAYASVMCTKALLGDPLAHGHDPAPVCHPSAVESIDRAVDTHRKHWASLRFRAALPEERLLDEPAPSRGLPGDDADADALGAGLLRLGLGECRDGHCGTDDEEDESTRAKAGPAAEKDGECVAAAPEPPQLDVEASEAGAGCSTSGAREQRPARVAQGTLVDYLSAQMPALLNEDMFAVVPLAWCPHLAGLHAPPPGASFAPDAPCAECRDARENWICLHCFTVACARAVQRHMQQHCAATGHALLLSLADLSAWCNACDAYVDHALLYEAKDRAHRAKFGEPMPWCYPSDSDALRLQPPQP